MVIRICNLVPPEREIQIGQRATHGKRRLDRLQRVIRLFEWRAEYREERVAEKLVERALVLEDHVGHPRKKSVQELGRLGRRDRLAERRETDEVTEHHRDVALLCGRTRNRLAGARE